MFLYVSLGDKGCARIQKAVWSSAYLLSVAEHAEALRPMKGSCKACFKELRGFCKGTP